MVFTSCAVMSFCGVDFVVEAAEVKTFSMTADRGKPSAIILIETNADETRGGLFSGFSPVEHILRVRSGAEIGLSVIKAVVISVVNEQFFRRFHNLPVHQ